MYKKERLSERNHEEQYEPLVQLLDHGLEPICLRASLPPTQARVEMEMIYLFCGARQEEMIDDDHNSFTSSKDVYCALKMRNFGPLAVRWYFQEPLNLPAYEKQLSRTSCHIHGP